MDMRDLNGMLYRLGMRLRELDGLVSEITFITKEALGERGELDLSNLTIMGHGFGATTALAMAAKDTRIKKLITYDAWMFPLQEEIKTKTLTIS
jgi:pimeloyl-ACP methyl ester carboxylesterase